jgi:hypothetical protein
MCSWHSVTQFASLQIDLLNIRNNWMKNIVWRAGFFAYFFCLQKKSKSHRRDSVRKHQADAAREDGVQQYLYLFGSNLPIADIAVARKN